jgi:alkanesulfonate monooxygenase SsuD/methylene tetrahydromethanopterin reductase-like flavin-dependent oxidoreductase (luciferase family)
MAWVAATTARINVGSAIMQMPARSPAATASTVATLDILSGGRVLLGLGTSGPQVAEGWHGQAWGKPLTRTREYVEIVRTILRREVPLEHHGEHYDIPVQGGTGLGKPLKLMARPLRPEIPIYLAAIGPKAVEQTFEIADGWLPIFWSPEKAGMGARGKNFYNDLFVRYGYEAEAREIQDLFLDGRQREAAGKVPDSFVDEVALVGSVERIRDRLAAWRESGVTTLLVSTRDVATLRAVAEAAS